MTLPKTHHGKRVRALHPWCEHDRAPFEFVSAPEHLLTGFLNGDMVRTVYPQAQTKQHKRKAAARIGYRIRLARAYGLIARPPRTRDTATRTKRALQANPERPHKAVYS